MFAIMKPSLTGCYFFLYLLMKLIINILCLRFFFVKTMLKQQNIVFYCNGAIT